MPNGFNKLTFMCFGKIPWKDIRSTMEIHRQTKNHYDAKMKLNKSLGPPKDLP
jgi:hypothetical protein